MVASMNKHQQAALYEQAMQQKAGERARASSVQRKTATQAAEPYGLVPERGGDTYEPEQDGSRLRAQLERVRRCMADGRWRTLAEVAEETGDPEASVSARLRDLRKEKFGGHTVNRERVSKGLNRYRLVLRRDVGDEIP